MTPRITPAMAARMAAMAFVLLAIAATAVQFQLGDQKPAAPVSSTPVMVDADPIRAELVRCQSLGEAGAHDSNCLRAWAANRRRFLGGNTPNNQPREP